MKTPQKPAFYIFQKPACVSVNTQKNLQVVASGEVGGGSLPLAPHLCPPGPPTRMRGSAPECDSLAVSDLFSRARCRRCQPALLVSTGSEKQ